MAIKMTRTINGRPFASSVWPNRIGEDIRVPSGTIEILWPVDQPSSQPFRARFIPNGKSVATMAGAARLPSVAVENLEPIETWPGLEPTPGGFRIDFKD